MPASLSSDGSRERVPLAANPRPAVALTGVEFTARIHADYVAWLAEIDALNAQGGPPASFARKSGQIAAVAEGEDSIPMPFPRRKRAFIPG